MDGYELMKEKNVKKVLKLILLCDLASGIEYL
jgi:hypothetical protein